MDNKCLPKKHKSRKIRTKSGNYRVGWQQSRWEKCMVLREYTGESCRYAWKHPGRRQYLSWMRMKRISQVRKETEKYSKARGNSLWVTQSQGILQQPSLLASKSRSWWIRDTEVGEEDKVKLSSLGSTRMWSIHHLLPQELGEQG